MKKIILVLLALTFFLLPQNLAVQGKTSPTKETVELLLGRFSAGTLRLEKIANRISSRLEKIKKDGFETISLDSQYQKLTKQLDELKSQLTETQEAATIFFQSQEPKNGYPSFRKQVIAVRDTLNNALAAEKSLVNNMKQYDTTAATPTATTLLTE